MQDAKRLEEESYDDFLDDYYEDIEGFDDDINFKEDDLPL
jgi:hypothetical protein